MAIALLWAPPMTAERVQPLNVSPANGAVREEISRSVVRLLKEHCGRGPSEARTYISDDLVVCVLRGGFSVSDRTLLEHGRAGLVVSQRQALEGTLRQPLIDLIERLVGRRVIACTSGMQPDVEICTEVFLLEPVA
jgi:uncharacterized protein YbcI